MKFKGDSSLKYLLDKLVEQGIYTKALADECKKSDYNSLINILQKNYFVISNLNNERLIRQSGAFLLVGQYNITIDRDNIDNSLVQLAKGTVRNEFNEEYFRIASEAKASILEELDFYNKNEVALFPELEHQMSYVKKILLKNTTTRLKPFLLNARCGLTTKECRHNIDGRKFSRFLLCNNKPPTKSVRIKRL